MGLCVCQGAILKCSFGNVPTPLMVLPVKKVNFTLPAAVKTDHIPFVNILPFGMCSNPANPMVIAATAAALGVLTPVPCIPATVQPWTKPSSKVKAGGTEIITKDSKLLCTWGGQIEIKFPGQIQIITS